MYIHKYNWEGLNPAAKSLRIEPEEFDQVKTEQLELLTNNYTSKRVQRFIKGLREDLKL